MEKDTGMTTTDVVDKLDGVISQVSDMLKEAVQKYGPDDVDIAMKVYRVALRNS